MREPRVTEEYTRRGLDVVVLENERLRVEVLSGKGGDVTELRDKRTDTNVLFESPHEWRAPDTTGGLRPDATFSFMDHYPGGWQDVLPAAGQSSTVAGAPFGQHGESTVLPWETRSRRTDDGVEVELTVDLTRYPLSVVRTLELPVGEPVLHVDERVSNRGEVPVRYAWLQHIVFGAPLVGPEATLDVPCETVVVDPDHDAPNARFEPGTEFTWPVCEAADGHEVDLREIPPKSERVHDLVALTDLDEGRYTLANPALDLEATVQFPEGLYEYVWYWQPFGGFESAPYFGRAYAAGLEPATSVPNAGLERAVENGTAETLAPGETQRASMTVSLQSLQG